MTTRTVAGQSFARPFTEDPRHSYTLPGGFYYDPAVLEREKEAIFAQSWQYVGHVSQIAGKGAFITRQIGGENIFVLRGGDGTVRAFYNVCRHRAHPLLHGEGTLRASITCPYHAWSYEHDGRLRAARGSEKVAGFERSEFCLKKLRLEEIGGFLFVNADDGAPALSERGEEIEADLRSFVPRPETLALAHVREYEIKANWKNVVENFCECYHCPNAHPSLSNGVFDIKSYRIDVKNGYHRHWSGSVGDDKAAYKIDRDAAPRGDEYAGWFIWPNVAFEVFPGGAVNVFHLMPSGPETTTQRIEWYLPKPTPSASEQEVIDYLHETVRLEDVTLVENVQRGLHSRAYGQGRFIVDRNLSGIGEHAVHDFQRRVLRALEEAPAA